MLEIPERHQNIEKKGGHLQSLPIMQAAETKASGTLPYASLLMAISASSA